MRLMEQRCRSFAEGTSGYARCRLETMHPYNLLRWASLFIVFLAGLGTASGETGSPGPRSRTGFEVYLHGSARAFPGRDHRLRGIAYEVIGLAELRPLAGGRIRARYASAMPELRPAPWVSVTADDRGRFEVDVPLPAQQPGTYRIEVRVGQGEDERSFFVPLELESPLDVELRTDRLLYEPGETVYVWVRVADVETGQPVENAPIDVELTGGGGSITAELTSGPSGVASWTYQLPETAEEGERVVEVEVGEGLDAFSRSTRFRVGQRAVARLSAMVEVSPSTAEPGEQVEVTIEVRTLSGSPVSGARVTLRHGNVGVGLPRTDGSGIARARLAAPAYLESERGWVSIRGQVTHPAHGSAEFSSGFTLSRPLALSIDAIVPHGGLVPEVEDELWITVLDAGGQRPEAGIEVEVSGAAVRGGRVRGALDANGLVVVPVSTPRDAVASHRGDGDPYDAEAATSLRVEVLGPHPRVARLCVPVMVQAQVAPRVDRPVVAPADTFVVTVSRRPAVADRPVAVDLLLEREELVLIDSVIVEAGSDRATFQAPPDRLGLFHVRARPLLERGTVEGYGAFDSLIVRPSHPSFVRLSADHEVYQVRDRATITVHSDPAGGRGWVALVARDLAMHGGEWPFRDNFLARSFSRAMLEPQDPEAERYLRAALAAHVQVDLAPNPAPPLVDELGLAVDDNLSPEASIHRMDLRDPLALADELRRRGLAEMMRDVEGFLARSLESGTLDRVTVARGRVRRFRDDLLELMYEDDEPPATLGGGRLTVPMVTEADPSFTFDNVARRVARRRLVQLLGVLARYLDPSGNESDRPRGAAQEPPDRWLSRLVQLGLLSPNDLRDPWGGTFVLHRTRRTPAMVLAVEATGWELLSPGPDGRAGTADDVRDPFERAVPQGTPYALASGEDSLMRALSRLSPGEEGLLALLEAYRRVSDEALEELIGDAAIAGTSEGAIGGLLGNMVGDNFGYGGLGLRGTGRGGGGTGSGTIGLGRLATIGHGGGGGRGAFSAIIRERFPATLRFVAAAELDTSGQTEIELPLADAITTYVVEAILWTAEGWVWSDRIHIRVEQEVVVDAPVPPVVVAGDRVRLPVRVSNRASDPVRARLGVRGSEELGLGPIDAGEVTLAPGEARDLPVEVVIERPGEGTILVEAFTPDGQRIDGTRRPIRAIPDARRVRDEREVIADGSGAVSLEVPSRAAAREGSRVQVVVGQALFEREESLPVIWRAWISAFTGRALDPDEVTAASESLVVETGGAVYEQLTLGRTIGSLWSSPEVNDHRIERALLRLTQRMGDREVSTPAQLAVRARLLLLLAPAFQRAEARPPLREQLIGLIERIRADVENGSALMSDVPWVWARVLAALAWTGPEGDAGARARELRRRVERSVLVVGDDVWLEGGPLDIDDDLLVATTVLALYEIAAGSRDLAFRLVRTASRLSRSDGGLPPRARGLSHEGWALARASAAMLTTGGEPSAVTLRVDGVERQVDLENGLAEIPVRELGSPGSHQVELAIEGGAIVLLRARAVYGLPWDHPPPGPEPMRIELEGEPGTRDQRSGLTLVVRNASPRMISEPVIELDLPAGAEVDERAREEMGERSARPPDFSGRTLTLYLSPLCPAATTTIELPFRWTVAGRLRGLGAVGYASDRPEAISILPSRSVEVAEPARDAAAQGGQP